MKLSKPPFLTKELILNVRQIKILAVMLGTWKNFKILIFFHIYLKIVLLIKKEYDFNYVGTHFAILMKKRYKSMSVHNIFD